ncbi:Na+/H+ antiporter NhaC [Emcibacteraceae bacterium]|nr:Na+/H+ antiporter NhaC [Emcibacteraceae bacterium]
MEINRLKMTTEISVFFLILMISFIAVSMLYLELPTRLTLLLTIILMSIVCFCLGHSAVSVEKYIVNGIRKSGLVVAILLMIGCVVGSWIASGIIPSIVYYGLEILTPTSFLIGGLVCCSLVSYFSGSSYACIGTVGVALMGIGQGLGLPLPLTAGLILSGAVFGDKMSPFSDTTNLAAASAGVPLFSHIHSMMFTTIPAWLIAAVLFLYFGTTSIDPAMNIEKIIELQNSITKHFTISPFLLLVPLLTIFLAIKRIPSIIAISFGAITGIISAFIFQDGFTIQLILLSLIGGLDYDFGTSAANQLFANRGGLTSMLFSVSVAMMALVLGEILTKLEILPALIRGVEKTITKASHLVIFTIFTCLSTVMLSASQYIAIVIPGEGLKLLYKKQKVSRRVLSRSLEDGGTIFSTLVPWGGDAAFVAATLGVATIEYLPYAFFSLLCPILSILFALFGFAVWDDSQDNYDE